MNKMTITLVTVWSLLVSSSAYAAAVPEIDGANSLLGLGLVAGIVALIREHRRHK
jgi:hypothetical protein